MSLAVKIRELQPRVVILPYWEARHPDHYRCAEMGFEACFLAGLKKLDEYSAPHRPQKILYSSLYADVKPSFVVDISAQFERRMTALLSYASQYGAAMEGAALFPDESGDPRPPGRHRAVLRQPDRRALRGAVRGEGSHAHRRHRGHAGALHLRAAARRRCGRTRISTPAFRNGAMKHASPAICKASGTHSTIMARGTEKGGKAKVR